MSLYYVKLICDWSFYETQWIQLYKNNLWNNEKSSRVVYSWFRHTAIPCSTWLSETVMVQDTKN